MGLPLGCNDFSFMDAAPEESEAFYLWLFEMGKSVGMVSWEPDFMNQVSSLSHFFGVVKYGTWLQITCLATRQI